LGVEQNISNAAAYGGISTVYNKIFSNYIILASSLDYG
jgi:hypothetical protein